MRWIAVLALIVSAWPAGAQGSLEDIELGAHLAGPRHDLGSLKGRTVVVLIWQLGIDVNQVAYDAMLKVQKQYQQYGLVALCASGAAVDKPTSAVLAAKVSAMGSRHPVTLVQASSFGIDVGFTPRFLIYDATGQLVWNGSERPSMDENAGWIHQYCDAMRARLTPVVMAGGHFLTGGRKFGGRAVSAVASKLTSGSAYGDALAGLQKVIDEGAAAEEVAEARWLAERIAQYGQSRLRVAGLLEAEAPVQAGEEYKRIAASFKGHALGEQARLRSEALKTDERYQDELKASGLWAAIWKKVAELKEGDGTRFDAGQLEALAQLVRVVIAKHPESHAARAARGLATELGIALE